MRRGLAPRLIVHISKENITIMGDPQQPTERQMTQQEIDQGAISLDLPDSVKIFIGNAIIKFSHMEVVVTELIWELAGLTFEDGRAITKNMQTKGKFQLARELCDSYNVLFPSPSFSDKTFWNAINDIIDERNIVAHSLWAIHENNVPICLSMKTKTTIKNHIYVEVFPLDRINLIATRSTEIAYALSIALSNVRQKRPTRP